MTATLELLTEDQATAAFTEGFTRRSERDKQVTPLKYLGADNALSLSNRLWSKVIKTEDCWEWTGAKSSKGYGSIYVRRYVTAATHIVAYELETGQGVPEGLTIDHLCFNTLCTRFAHFEVVTSAVNSQRRWERYRLEVKPFITHCPHGHELTEGNTYITPVKESKRCKTCIREAGRRHDAKRGWRR